MNFSIKKSKKTMTLYQRFINKIPCGKNETMTLCSYPLSLYHRLTLPYYALIILNDCNISDKAKSEFLKTDANNKRYFSDIPYPEYSGKITCFREDRYMGILGYQERDKIVNEYNKKNKTSESSTTFFYTPLY